MINQAVPPGGDLCIALRQVEACDLPKRGRLGCEIFGSGGLRSRVPRIYETSNIITLTYVQYICACEVQSFLFVLHVVQVKLEEV